MLRRLPPILLLLLLVHSCQGTIPRPGPPDRRGQEAAKEVDLFLRGFEELYVESVRRAASIGEAIRARSDDEDRFHHPEVLKAAYGRAARVKGAPAPLIRFVTHEGLNPAGQRLMEELGAAGRHVLEPATYHHDVLVRLIEAWGKAAPSPDRPPPPPRGPEVDRLRRLVDRALRASADHVARRVMRRIARGPSLPRIARAHAAAVEARRARARTAARAELLLADGLLAHARDLSRGNTRRASLDLELKRKPNPAADSAEAPNPPGGAHGGEAPASAPASATPAAILARGGPPALVRVRLRRDLESVRDLRTLEKLLAELPPPHAQYHLLLKARRQYQQIVADGGWPGVRPVARLRVGRRSARIRALKERLTREGYYEGPVDQTCDDGLIEAVKSYRATHQMRAAGRPDRWFWSSLNQPAAHRLRSIELTIQRWRESSIGRASFYVLVNIPDFHVEVWRDGKRIHRQPTVVGRRRPYRCDEATEQRVLAHATPIQAAWISTLVFSPFWNVTRRIKETELDPERGKDPLFYEKHGYEVMKPGTRREWVRELPGPANSLGFVKFLFPNPHETYLHGSPFKSLFRRPVRAFSHGCMRVQDTWGLARLLLKHDGQWRAAHYRQLRLRWQSMNFRPLRKEWDRHLYEDLRERAAELATTVKLRRRVPIHVEYYTVRVDDAGRTHFLADIYQLDKKRLSPRKARRCVPESRLARRGFASMMTRVDALVEQALELAPCVKQAGPVIQTLETGKRARGKRLLKRIKRLETFSAHHANLTRHSRDEYDVLVKELEERKGRWRQSLINRAVKVNRLIVALAAMTLKGKATCALVTRLAKTPPATPPAR